MSRFLLNIEKRSFEQMVAALERQIDALPTRADAMPVTEQIRRVAELEATVLD